MIKLAKTNGDTFLNYKIRTIFILTAFAAFVFPSNERSFILKTESLDEIKISFNNNLSEDFSNKEGYIRLDVKDKGHRSKVGEPEVPYISTLVQINPNRKYSVEYSVKSSRKIEGVKIFPFQGYEYQVSQPIEKVDDELYSTDIQFPGQKIYFSEPGLMRGIAVSSLSFSPYSYNPNKRTLEIYDEVDIVVRDIGPSTDQIEMHERKRSHEFESLISDDIVNYNYSLTNVEYQQPSILYICGGSSASNSAFQQLVEWRRERGYVVYVSSLSDIGSSAYSIKEHIRSVYYNNNPAPEHVTLVGDVSGDFDIPTYAEGYGHNDYGNYCEGDQPYTELEGSDLFPEVFLGRMSVQNNSELTTVSYKIMNYEN